MRGMVRETKFIAMITKRQEMALESIMTYSDDGSIISKAICWFLIKKSEFFKKPVCMTILQSDTVPHELVTDVSKNVSNIWNRFKNTKLESLIVIAGSDFIFSTHPGDYHDGKWNNGFDTRRYAITVWLSPVKYDHSAERYLFDLIILKDLPTVDEPF